MKSLGKIILYVLFALAFIGLAWVLLTGTSNILISSAVSSFMVFLVLVSLLVTVALFFMYKVTDIMKHPKHLKELMLVFGIIIISLILSFILDLILGSGGTFIDKNTGKSYSAGTMRLIGVSIRGCGIMLLFSALFLVWDVLKGLIKS